MTSIITTYFCPTDEQAKFAREYLIEAGLDSGFVAVNFPGKQAGVWTEGQVREAVMDGSFPAIWVDKDSALSALDTRAYGTAMFRIYVDGRFHVIDELE